MKPVSARATPISKPRKQGGFLILEAAIAFVLISLGMVGLLMLSAKGSRASQENFERSEAVNLATQIAAKVRSSGDGLTEWHNVNVLDSATWATADVSTVAALTEMKRVATDRLTNAEIKVTLRAMDGKSACAAVPCDVHVKVDWLGATQQANDPQLQMRSYSISSFAGLQ
jgi:Tfp pilus assembly protein PilV